MASKNNTNAQKGNAKRRFNKLSRWLHIYLSMVSFAVVLFFSFTGLTLNHPSWLGGEQQVLTKARGTLKLDWVNPTDTNKIAKLETVEFLRKTHGVKGAFSEFRIDEAELGVVFKGPAYACDVFIDRQTGNYEISEIEMGVVALMNDLHKGRDAGGGWAWVIDIVAIFLIIISLTGLILLCFIKKKRAAGLMAMAIGAIVCYMMYVILVP